MYNTLRCVHGFENQIIIFYFKSVWCELFWFKINLFWGDFDFAKVKIDIILF